MWYPAKIEVAFGADRVADPAAIPSAAWSDITEDVVSWTTKRGRSYELSEMQTGVGSVTLHNHNMQYSPDYNAASDNLLPLDVATGGSTLAGEAPEGYLVNSGAISNTTFGVAARLSTSFASKFVYQFTITGASSAAPKTMLRGAADDESGAGPFTIGSCVRVDPSTQYTFSANHRLDSGTGTAMRLKFYWLDSDGEVLSSTTGSTFTPTGTVANASLTATSNPSARYVSVSVEYQSATTVAQTTQFGDLAFMAGASAVWVDPLNYPNIRPGNPVRITAQDSTVTYQPVFYGFTGEWAEELDSRTVTVELVDSFEMLAEQELENASKELLELIDPLVAVPFDDGSETRYTRYTVHTRTGEQVTRGRTGIGAANATSEVVFGEDGPQDGTGAVYLDPESSTVGWSLRADIPPALTWMNKAEHTVWFWFKMRRREHDGRIHRLHQAMTQDGEWPLFTVFMLSDGTVRVAWGGAIGNPAIDSDNTYHDGEWHLLVASLDEATSPDTVRLWVDWDGGNGEAKSANTFNAGMTGFTGNNIVYFGPQSTAGTDLPRVRLSSFGAVDRELTTDELVSLYLTGVPPALSTGENENIRIEQLLNFARWPVSARDMDSGKSTIVGPYPSGTTILEAIRDTARAAGGQVFVTKSGDIAYRNRSARYNPTVGLACSVANATMPENDLSPAIDSQYIFNRVRVIRTTGGGLEVNDAKSQARYGVRTLELDMDVSNDLEAEQAAYWHLNLYKDPVARIPSVTFLASAADNSNLWDFLVGLELMELDATVSLGTTTLGSRVFFVESIELTYEQETLTFQGVLQLSPADGYTNICTLDDGDTGVLDSCILGW